MDLISIMVVISVLLLYIALTKKDSTLIYFAGFLILLNGLYLMNNQYFNFDTLKVEGVVFCFLAIYLMVRTSIELIRTPKKKEVEDNE